MQTRTVGTTMPVLEVTLAPGERIIAEGDEIGWLTPGLGMETSTRFGSGGKGGFKLYHTQDDSAGIRSANAARRTFPAPTLRSRRARGRRTA